MFPLYINTKTITTETVGLKGSESGLAMVVTLLLLLVITLMGVGISYLAYNQFDMVEAVVNKPMSIEAGETCFDNAIEWLGTSAGKKWVNGEGASIDLVANGELTRTTLLDDTVASRKNPNDEFSKRVSHAGYSSCELYKFRTLTTVNGDSGNEIGTSNGYGDSSLTYIIKITAIGNFSNSLFPNATWNSNSSRSELEAVIKYTP